MKVRSRSKYRIKLLETTGTVKDKNVSDITRQARFVLTYCAQNLSGGHALPRILGKCLPELAHMQEQVAYHKTGAGVGERCMRPNAPTNAPRNGQVAVSQHTVL